MRSVPVFRRGTPAEAAAAELERAVKELGAVGALVNGYNNIGDEDTARYLDEDPVDVIWSKVSELNVPVYLHPRIPSPSQQRIFQAYEGLLGSAGGFGQETSTHALRLILSGLFDRHPNVNVILGHCGEGLPFTLPRVEHRLRYQRRETQGPRKPPPTVRTSPSTTAATLNGPKDAAEIASRTT